MITIRKRNEISVNSSIWLIYGYPGVGKTSLALSAKNPVLLDTDRGAHRADGDGDVILIDNYAEMSHPPTFIQQVKDYDTIVIDTADGLLDYMMNWVQAENPRIKNKLQLYGLLREEFKKLAAAFKVSGKSLIFIAHAKETLEGETKIVRPQITGGSYDIITRESDFIGLMSIKDGKRVLSFTPDENYISKDSAGLKNVVIDTPPNLQDIMQGAVEKINSKNAERAKVLAELKVIREEIENADSLDHLNRIIQEQADKPLVIKKQIAELIKGSASRLGGVLKNGKVVEA